MAFEIIRRLARARNAENNKNSKNQTSEIKQVILIRADLKMPKGKVAVQAAHASVDAVLKSDKKIIALWKSQGMKKAALKVWSLRELKEYEQKSRKKGLVSALIRDAGKTTLKPGTTTALAIGPDYSDKIDFITGHLKML